ncbi:MAG: glycosyltransferase family 4 protein [candidate division Zixibacteria bacterium]|nr:glycosyltransferase family 4 protein [candidate division Zixibacteria bacterium]
MRILQVLTSASWGGLEKVPLDWHNFWLTEGKEAYLLARAGTPLAEKRHETPNLFTVPSRLKLLAAVRRLTAEKKLDLIISHYPKDLPYLVWGLRKFPETKLFLVKHLSPGRPKKDFYHRWLYAKVSRILPVSDFLAERCRTVYPVPPEKIVTLHNGILPENWKTTPQLREKTRAELGWSADEIVVGMIARITPKKGHLDLIRLAPQLLEKEPKLRFLIVGGWYPDDKKLFIQCFQEIKRQGLGPYLFWSGPEGVPDVRPYLAAADIFLSLAYEESFGLSVIEAMAAGLPVVGPQAGAIPEIITDGAEGYLIPLADFVGSSGESFVQAVVKLATDAGHRKKMGQAGQKKVAEKFALPLILKRLEEIYETAKTG